MEAPVYAQANATVNGGVRVSDCGEFNLLELSLYTGALTARRGIIILPTVSRPHLAIFVLRPRPLSDLVKLDSFSLCIESL